ncbi:MAG: NAD(P)/FAD-dependent oxidoreductase [Hydrogenophaga sp.]|uniref:NAD(P)/FAD-dependent oxidoreductase n=1 Tax=Hydrogenophaga sp. TaxID=1904254 RepID=UPI002731F85F|nr:NAD(P)/FAD-dependent oxidoreductase [Hydrogenophaga sp.]MDP2408261.1 NAD(P)/FAD-dependent oxidoreductase [Hydrogenophaga sp.]MDZ4177415.1 NAD(P)/FAD-dependent oxidoreductase [Hydrogenophaga sp.]
MHTPHLNTSRREWLAQALGLLSVAAAPSLAFAQNAAHIVIVGGGVGGATAAKYLKLFNPALQVTVIEKNPVYVRPYGSSEVLNQHARMDDLNVGYDTLKSKYGIRFVFDTVTGFDPVARVVNTAGQQKIGYDKLIVSPGIQLMYSAYAGYSEPVARTAVPSGWIPGEQTALLAKQLQGMRQGGTFVLAAPPNPYRCPPGPYERAALMTEWFQKHNPTAKVIIVDPKDSFVTDETMMLGWNRLYNFNLPEDYVKKMSAEVEVQQHSGGSMLSWVRGQDGGRTLKIDAKQMRIETEAETIRADVINVIPPMKAGQVAMTLGLADGSGFCPVERRTFASTLQPNVYVIGDASIADAMPKSGFSANTQAKVVARAIVEELAGRAAPEPLWENTCYALAGKDYGLFVADVFKIIDGKIARINGKGRYLPLNATPAQIKLGARYQQAWLRTFTADCFA